MGVAADGPLLDRLAAVEIEADQIAAVRNDGSVVVESSKTALPIGQPRPIVRENGRSLFLLPAILVMITLLFAITAIYYTAWRRKRTP